MVLIAPSLLSADFSALGHEISNLAQAQADWIHFDVMDGHFVPNITMGPAIIRSVRPLTQLPFDVHLMIDPVDDFIPKFAEAGADWITIHIEAGKHHDRSLRFIRSLGKKAGISLNPATPIESIMWLWDLVDLVLVMTVNPGFGGQEFISVQLEKIRILRQKLDQYQQQTNRKIMLEVDGGIQAENCHDIIQAGADILVAGTAISHGGVPNYAKNIASLRGVAETNISWPT